MKIFQVSKTQPTKRPHSCTTVISLPLALGTREPFFKDRLSNTLSSSVGMLIDQVLTPFQLLYKLGNSIHCCPQIWGTACPQTWGNFCFLCRHSNGTSSHSSQDNSQQNQIFLSSAEWNQFTHLVTYKQGSPEFSRVETASNLTQPTVKTTCMIYRPTTNYLLFFLFICFRENK